MHRLLLPSFASAATRLQEQWETAPYMLDAQHAAEEAAACSWQTRRVGTINTLFRLCASLIRVPRAS